MDEIGGRVFVLSDQLAAKINVVNYVALAAFFGQYLVGVVDIVSLAARRLLFYATAFRIIKIAGRRRGRNRRAGLNLAANETTVHLNDAIFVVIKKMVRGHIVVISLISGWIKCETVHLIVPVSESLIPRSA